MCFVYLPPRKPVQNHSAADMTHQLSVFLIFSALLLASCNKNDPAPAQGFEVLLPSNFPAPVYDFAGNPVTQAGFELGRKLFYDPILSRDNTISCGSCHIQYSAFTHHGHGVSHGIDGLLGKRNAPAIQNMAWGDAFFWDGGVPLLDLVPLNPIANPVEMDEQPARVLEKLRLDSEYPGLFKRAFGTEEINTARFLQAMSQFMASLVSANSRYDKYVRNEPGGSLTAEELTGLNTFRQKCANCHQGDLFTDNSFRNNGLNDDFTHDGGRYTASLLEPDLGKFKVPSLRNVEKTAPYMHDGTRYTLEAVLEHYAGGVLESPTLDPLLRKPDGTRGIALSVEDQKNIIAFLKTLTDEEFLRDTRFSEQ